MQDFVAPWAKFSSKEPEIGSIPSLIVSVSKPPPATGTIDNLLENIDKQETNIILLKHTNVIRAPFLRHYFIQIGNIVWHPGASDKYNGFRPATQDENEKSHILTIMEFCHYCTYDYLKNCHKRNAAFFLPTNNCELIVGRFEETALIYVLFIIILIICVKGIGIITIVILLSIILFFILITKPPQTMFEHCKHISLFNKLHVATNEETTFEISNTDDEEEEEDDDNDNDDERGMI